MLFHKAINSCCKDVVQNKPYLNNKYCNYTNHSLKFNLDAAIHVLTPKLASQWLMQTSYKNHFLFQKECGRPYDFCRKTNKVIRTNCVCIVHPRTTIFSNQNLTIPIINNVKKIFISDQNILCMHTQYRFVTLAY